MKEPLFLRADANARIGAGHFMRLLAMGQFWKRMGGRPVFLSLDLPAPLVERLSSEEIALRPLKTGHVAEISSLASEFAPIAGQWLILDGYEFDSAYSKEFQRAGFRIVMIDDEGLAAPYHCEIVLNQNVTVDPTLYQKRAPATELLLGAKYALLREEFRSVSPRKGSGDVIRSILVTFGGSDPTHLGSRVARTLVESNSNLSVTLLSGPTTEFEDPTVNACIQRIQNATSMPQLLLEHDIAFSAAGVTSLELAHLGVPAALVAVVPNENANATGLAKAGAAVQIASENLESSVKWAFQQISPIEIRKEMSERARRIVDGLGCFRLWLHLREPSLIFRNAENRDVRQTWEWSNEESVRRASFRSDSIPMGTHEKWFTEIIFDPAARLWIIEDREGKLIGQVRFEQREGTAFISVSVDSAGRGNSTGTLVIWCACRKYFREKDEHAPTITALIKLENEPSLKAFQKAGFVAKEQQQINGIPAVLLEVSAHELP